MDELDRREWIFCESRPFLSDQWMVRLRESCLSEWLAIRNRICGESDWTSGPQRHRGSKPWEAEDHSLLFRTTRLPHNTLTKIFVRRPNEDSIYTIILCALLAASVEHYMPSFGGERLTVENEL
jgi:hypothetical protein